MVLTGLRGVGKTVLLDCLKPLAIERNWLWVGTDLSESTSASEERTVLRLCTDLSVVTSNFVVGEDEQRIVGFERTSLSLQRTLSYDSLISLYRDTPGLASDKLKKIIEIAWAAARSENLRGIIFAYDEAQNLSDQAEKEEFPLSLLLDVFQSIQKVGLPMMLVLTGLPTLFPKLVEARTYSERMFRVFFLDRLNERESRDAILKPIQDANCKIVLNKPSVETITSMSGGYPYFIQFICREVYDAFIQQLDKGQSAAIPSRAIQRKLDTDFFAGRWSRATDRQRDLLSVIAKLESSDFEFTVQEVVELSRQLLEKGFSPSHVNQMLSTLSNQGLVFKNRYGKYSFAVPLMGQFINRQELQQ
jgi:hypothetical protein